MPPLTIKPRTFAARNAKTKRERDKLNEEIMTSEYGPDSKYALLSGDDVIMLFKTEEDAKAFLAKDDDAIAE